MLLYAFAVSSMQIKKIFKVFWYYPFISYKVIFDLSIHKDMLNHDFLSASGAIGFFHLKFKPDILQIADFQTIIMM